MKDRFVERHTSECSNHNLPREAQQRCSSRHRPETMLALCSVFTPLSCYRCNYLWPDGKYVHEVESLSLCVQFTNVQSVTGTFSTVCPSSTHTFRLLLEMKCFRCRESNFSLEYNNQDSGNVWCRTGFYNKVTHLQNISLKSDFSWPKFTGSAPHTIAFVSSFPPS